ncbi:unnamed protein product [marine sediment metagenome]|uniref:RRM domain-containing protein n=1 Tax=marine sediment metagenome TaxID=412755 RepID=X1FHH8_9ZZZZ
MSRSTIFVGNIDLYTSDRELENIFSMYGNIKKINLKERYAFISFETKEQAYKAIIKESYKKNKRFRNNNIVIKYPKNIYVNLYLYGPNSYLLCCYEKHITEFAKKEYNIIFNAKEYNSKSIKKEKDDIVILTYLNLYNRSIFINYKPLNLIDGLKKLKFFEEYDPCNKNEDLPIEDLEKDFFLFMKDPFKIQQNAGIFNKKNENYQSKQNQLRFQF